MRRMVYCMAIALAGTMTGSGGSAAQAAHVAEALSPVSQPQVFQVPAPPVPSATVVVASRVGPVQTVHWGGVDYQSTAIPPMVGCDW